MRTGLTIGLVAAAMAMPSPVPAREAAIPYRGFAIDASAVRNDPDRDALVDAARTQIDTVLRVGLSDRTIRVLEGYPVQLSRGPGGGHFNRDGVFVNLPPRPDPRPILLHEMMHAYQARLLPGGGDNPELRRFFGEAKRGGVWPKGSYMLSNINEFFAMTTSVYLNGSAARPPFTRAALEEKQPDYAAWLGRTIR